MTSTEGSGIWECGISSTEGNRKKWQCKVCGQFFDNKYVWHKWNGNICHGYLTIIK